MNRSSKRNSYQKRSQRKVKGGSGGASYATQVYPENPALPTHDYAAQGNVIPMNAQFATTQHNSCTQAGGDNQVISPGVFKGGDVIPLSPALFKGGDVIPLSPALFKGGVPLSPAAFGGKRASKKSQKKRKSNQRKTKRSQ
jgi:hypothetical protein